MQKNLLTGDINIAVITAEHPFDVPAFYEIFKNMKDINSYIQTIDNFAADWGKVSEKYDAVLFFNMSLDTPTDERGWLKVHKGAIEEIAQRGQGIIVLHHALVAYPDWDVWGELCGVRERTVCDYSVDETVRYSIADRNHPITIGMDDWEMIDEIYKINSVVQGDYCDILLTTDHPESMKTIAWTKNYNNSRVFCYQSGHNRNSFDNENFRMLLKRGIQWAARKI